MPAPSPAPGSRPAWWGPLALLGGWLVLAVLFPFAALTVLLLHIALSVALAVGPLRTALCERARSRPRPVPADRPFVSVHVPICDEPPALVCRTLDALARLDYDAFEVIVLDNNTPDQATWEPVAAHCRRLGRRFRFVHVDRMEGAKAGALTRCLRLADPRTEWVLTVDADYAVLPELLADALPHLHDPSVGAVQFPQAYSNTDGAPGLAAEYDHFFDVYMPHGAEAGAMLLTGTLSLIRRSALDAVGGWSAATITEDADLGLRLAQAGWSGVYLAQQRGHGLMPTDLVSLRKQRARWACGNAQTMRAALRAPLSDRRGRWASFAQLGAWRCGIVLPALAALGVALAPTAGAAHAVLLQTAALAIAVALGSKALLMSRTRSSTGVPWRPFVVHLALAWEGAAAWLSGLLGARPPFVRTPKGAQARGYAGAAPALTLATALTALGGVLVTVCVFSASLLVGLGVAMALGVVVLVRELGAAARAAEPVRARAEARLLRPARPTLARPAAPLALAS